MKIFIYLFLLIIIFSHCGSSVEEKKYIPAVQKDVLNSDFFPVTNYIKGQILEIARNSINPLKIISTGNKQDSVWLKVEELDAAFGDFLTPEIDSKTLSRYFKEHKFMDQTLNTFTFTYEPMENLPDSVKLQRWDVYINPENNSVKRIYLEKKAPDNKSLQLTWQANEWCRIASFSSRQTKEKEIFIQWRFD